MDSLYLFSITYGSVNTLIAAECGGEGADSNSEYSGQIRHTPDVGRSAIFIKYK
jgi:hypothetical protein